MPQEHDFLNQFAVVWYAAGRDNYNNLTVSPAVEVPARWEWKTRESRLADGNSKQVVAEVLLDRELPIGSLLWQGRLMNLLGTGTGVHVPTDEEYLQIIDFDSIPDIKERDTQYTAYLMRYSGKLPTVV